VNGKGWLISESAHSTRIGLGTLEEHVQPPGYSNLESQDQLLRMKMVDLISFDGWGAALLVIYAKQELSSQRSL